MSEFRLPTLDRLHQDAPIFYFFAGCNQPIMFRKYIYNHLYYVSIQIYPHIHKKSKYGGPQTCKLRRVPTSPRVPRTDAAQGIRSRSREVTAPPLMGGEIGEHQKSGDVFWAWRSLVDGEIYGNLGIFGDFWGIIQLLVDDEFGDYIYYPIDWGFFLEVSCNGGIP